eukprot:1188160-Prorocentrum_minimum.AAC.3
MMTTSCREDRTRDAFGGGVRGPTDISRGGKRRWGTRRAKPRARRRSASAGWICWDVLDVRIKPVRCAPSPRSQLCPPCTCHATRSEGASGGPTDISRGGKRRWGCLELVLGSQMFATVDDSLGLPGPSGGVGEGRFRNRGGTKGGASAWDRSAQGGARLRLVR